MSFNRDDRRGGGGRDFGGGRSFGSGRGRSDRPPVQMHKAICSNCGKECEVPFKPTGAKPVFCSDCFREQGGPNRNSSDRGPRNFERRDERPIAAENPQIKVQMSGQAIGYRSIALQSDLFAKKKYFQEPVFSNLSLDEKGNVVFDLDFSVDPNFVEYNQALLRGDDANSF